MGRRSRHIIGGPINLISVYSYEPFQGDIFMGLRYHLDPLQPLHVITNGSECFGEKKKEKRKVTNTIEGIYSYFEQISLSG